MEDRNQRSERNEYIEGTTPVVIPVIQEQLTVDKEVVETGKVIIHKRVVEEEQTLNIPLLHESYEVEHVPVNKMVDAPPPVRYEGDTVIIPVVHEVLIVEKRFEVIEEVHVIKKKTATPHTQQVTLQKDEVEIERISSSANRKA